MFFKLIMIKSILDCYKCIIGLPAILFFEVLFSKHINLEVIGV
jgi:hypothetical protein